ncbi:hypothetical protein H6G97_43235 [Nostoc flagelliforme FACHB-838]|uniref:Transposase n=1 Tax=Nostoc flagelliforme FACHB-838 TaxID=2692904 RepID=A0ABR8E2Z1_9NOSO|nr:hypothetical protein [Nostoc flagelliforme FACHB-838]
MFISSQLQTDGVHFRALSQYVERFYSTHAYNWHSTGHQLRKVLPHPSYNLTSLLSRCGDISLKLQPKDIGCQIAKVVQGIIPYSDSRSVNNFSSTTVRFGRFSFPNNCNRLLTVSSSESEYTRPMRSPTVGGYAIANHPHLLTLRRQVFAAPHL